MDKNRFDGFTRQLAKRETRRQAIKTLFAGGVGTAATVLIASEAEAAKTDCCPADHPTLCGLTCTDTITSVDHCGDCDTTCGPDERCYKGVCESTSIVHCATVADCPGSNTECSTITCKKGICGVTFAASGKKVSGQTAGDCQKNVCDGAGHIISIVDNTDKPPASSLCTTGICVDGVPQQKQKAVGAKCPTGKCNAAGQCSGGGCFSAAECPPSANECQTAVCTNGRCGFTFLAEGTETSEQLQGDCLKHVCDGNGQITTVDDDSDIPAPVEPGSCSYGSCSNGQGTIVNLPYGTICNDGICDGNGNCGALPNCFSDGDCPASGNECFSSACQGGACVDIYALFGTPTSFQQPSDCQQNVCDGSGGTTTIPDDADLPIPYYTDVCLIGVCNGGNASFQQAPAGSSCSDGMGGVVCNDSGACVGCLDDTYCPDLGIGHARPICSGGYCSYECEAGWGDCVPDGLNGCETNLATDNDHCGVCGNICTAGTSCQNGTCA